MEENGNSDPTSKKICVLIRHISSRLQKCSKKKKKTEAWNIISENLDITSKYSNIIKLSISRNILVTRVKI